MSKLFCLDDRLGACASFVQNGARLADIGTDHARLPVWLILKGVASFAVAGDINPLPLEKGKVTAEKYGVTSIDFREGSGLDVINVGDRITDVVIAGMGGELILDIITGSALTENENLNIILQPMTRSQQLIEGLYQNGFEIVAQKCAVASGKCYTVMKVKYCGIKQSVDDVFCCVGKLKLSDEKSQRFVRQHIKHLKNKSNGDSYCARLAERLEQLLMQSERT